MSDRERWVIYPLLVFALGLGIRPLVMPQTGEFDDVTCDHLVCKELTLRATDSQRRLAHLGPTPEQRPQLVLFADEERPAVRLAVEPEGQGGEVEGNVLRIRSREGKRIAEIAAGAEGLGAVTLFGRKDTEPLVRLKAAEQGAALEAFRGEKAVWP
jgi:hypothetical protein